MGTFTSKYRVTDGYGNTSTQTRIDAGKSLDAFGTALFYLTVVVTVISIGIWTSGFLLYLFKTLKKPSNISYKDMQDYGIETKSILNSKRNAWVLIIITFPIAPITGWIYFFTMKSKLKIPFSVTREFNNNFILSYYNAIDNKKKIINNAVSVHGRDSQEFIKIAQQEVDDLMKVIEDEFHYAPKIMKTLEEKTKVLLQLNIPLESTQKNSEEVVYSINDNCFLTQSSFITQYYKYPLSSITKASIISKNTIRNFLKVLILYI